MNFGDLFFALNLAFLCPFLFGYVLLSIAGAIREMTL